MTIKKYFFLLTILFLQFNAPFAQNSFTPFSYIFDNQSLEDSINGLSFAGIGRDSSRQVTINTLLTQPNSLSWQNNLPQSSHYYYHWAYFRLINRTEDTLKRFIWVPSSFDYIKLYEIEKNIVIDSTIRGRVPPLSIRGRIYELRTIALQLPPQSETDFYLHYYSPTQVPYRDSFFLFNQTRLTEVQQRLDEQAEYDLKFSNFLYTFLFLLMFMTLIQYYIFPRDAAFLYYIGYLLCVGLYYFNRENMHHRYFPIFDFFRSHFYLLDIVFAYACFAFYNLFVIKFTEAGKNQALLMKGTRFFIVIWLILIPIHSFIMSHWSIATNYSLFISLRFIFLIVGIVSFFYVIKYGQKSLNPFIYIGTAFLLFFILRGAIESLTETFDFYPHNWFNQLGNKYRFMGIKLGILLESVFFFTGLIFKGKQLSKERHLAELALQKQYIEQLETSQKWQHKYQTELEHEIRIKTEQLLELEKQQAIERTRRQIAQDIHDEEGLHLTKIILTSELAAKWPDKTNDRKVHFATHIADEARQVVSKLKEIIFIISTEKATFYELQAYIREKTNEFWKNSNVSLEFDFPNDESHQKVISIDMKRHLLMIFRESQNNIAKHAQATEIHLSLKIIDKDRYFFSIQDNGNGFEQVEKNGFSRGLKGIYNRAESIGASASIKSVVGNGTSIKIWGFFNYT